MLLVLIIPSLEHSQPFSSLPEIYMLQILVNSCSPPQLFFGHSTQIYFNLYKLTEAALSSFILLSSCFLRGGQKQPSIWERLLPPNTAADLLWLEQESRSQEMKSRSSAPSYNRFSWGTELLWRLSLDWCMQIARFRGPLHLFAVSPAWRCLREDCRAGWHAEEGSRDFQSFNQNSGSPAERREVHCNTLTASVDLITAGDMKNTLRYGLSSKYLPLHLEGAKTCKFTHLNAVLK